MTNARRPAPDARPVALTIAGSDSGGGAGIQADLKTMEAHGAFGTSAITAVTAQNTRGVESSYVLPPAEIDAQIEAVLSDFDVAAAKTGMLATAPVVELVADRLAGVDFPVVVDPVMVAASGDRLLEPDAEDAYGRLIAGAELVTPNADEAAVLTGTEPVDEEGMRAAGDDLVGMGATAALVKGGHVPGERVLDVLVTGGDTHVFEHPRVDTDATHGSGCTVSSAITAGLAAGQPLEAAVEAGVAFMERAVRYPLDVGTGPGSVHHVVALRDRAERQPTQEAVEGIVRRFVDRDVSRIVPEVGMNVVAATPYAEAPEETAAVEGRIARTASGVHPNRGVRFGASSHVARFLLAAREFDPSLRFAVNCRFDPDVEAALGALDGPVAEYDRANQPPAVESAPESTMGWAAREVFDGDDRTPVAVIDRGAVGKEAMLKLLAAEAETVAGNALALCDRLAA